MQSTRQGLWLTFFALVVSVTHAQDASPTADVIQPYRDAAIQRWETEIQRIEQLDQEQPDPADGVLLIGSSSIRLWKNVAADLAPYRTIQRGYGGAKYSDLAVFAERLIHPHSYRAIVMFVGNDVTGSKDDRTPDEVEKLVRYIIHVSRQHQPNAPILVVEVTPTPKRFDAWPAIRQLNARLREIALTEANTYFVATAEHYLDRDDQPRANLFGNDRLHQNESGYAVWADVIRRRLDEVFRLLAHDDSSVPAGAESRR